LKVFSKRDEHVLGLLEIRLVRDPGHVHGQSDGEIKGVKGRFIRDDERMFFEGEFREIDRVFRGGEEIEKLAQFSLISGLPKSAPHICNQMDGIEDW
jgi:hypothetical protein